MNKILSISLLLLLAITSIVLFSTKENALNLPANIETGKAQVGGAFALTDTEGKTVSDAAFRGQFMLVFFGFTQCPHICPTTLATLTSTMSLLGEKASLITPIFISVDAENDTPARMKEFLTNFDSRIVGLTGNAEQIKAVSAVYKSYYSEQADGQMDHSAFIYLMDQTGEYLSHFSYDIAPEALAKALAERVHP